MVTAGSMYDSVLYQFYGLAAKTMLDDDNGRESFLMGWTGCFPDSASLYWQAVVIRRSSYEAEDGTEHRVTGSHRCRHRQGGFSHCRVGRRREDCFSGGRSGDWVSKTRSRSCRRASSAWKPA